ncbi:hypothetical protein KI387_021811, partial [Taxus chinensis]
TTGMHRLAEKHEMEPYEVVDNVGRLDVMNMVVDMMDEVEIEHVAREYYEQTKNLMQETVVGYNDADG